MAPGRRPSGGPGEGVLQLLGGVNPTVTTASRIAASHAW